MSFGRRDSQKAGSASPPVRSRQATSAAPGDAKTLDALAAEMRHHPKPGMSLTTQWMIVGPIMLLLIALLVMFPKGGADTDPVEVAAVDPDGVEESIRNAYALCKWADQTGLQSAPCAVSGWDASVTLTIDTNSSEARKMCASVVNEVRRAKMKFGDRWTFRVASPYSATSIAMCDLPG